MVNAGYLIPLGLVKGAEFICALISWALVADYKVEVDKVTTGFPYPDHFLFLLAMGIIGWLFAMIWFVLNIIDLLPKQMKNHIVFAVIHIVLGTIVLAAGAWAGDKWFEIDTSLATGESLRWAHQFKSSAAFGIITGILYIVDGNLHFVVGKRVYGDE
jgi:fluoride ion exporter CrcB/FEX